MSKKFIVLAVIVVVVLVAVGVLIGVKFLAGQPSGAAASAYSAVYLTTGDIYYGKLSWFPWPHLKNVYFLQRGQDAQGQTQLGLIPFMSSFWGPVDEVYLNPREVVFWTRLRNDSQVAKALGNPAALQQAPQQQLPPASNATSTR